MSSLCIYNPSLARSESSELDQIVYFGDYAGEISEGAKLRHVGLIQGIVAFAQSFSEDDGVDAINSTWATIIPVNVETSWWIAVTLSLDGEGDDATKDMSKYQISEELWRAYRAFCMDNGTFTQLLQDNARESVCEIVESWWSDHVHILRKSLSMIDSIASTSCKGLHRLCQLKPRRCADC